MRACRYVAFDFNESAPSADVGCSDIGTLDAMEMDEKEGSGGFGINSDYTRVYIYLLLAC